MMAMMLMMVMNFQCKEIQFNDLNASENIDQGLALRAHAQIPHGVFVFLFGGFYQTFGWLQWNISGLMPCRPASDITQAH